MYLAVEDVEPDTFERAELRMKLAARETCNHVLAEMVGKLMFKYHDTYGLSMAVIDKEVNNFLDSKDTKDWFELFYNKVFEMGMAELKKHGKIIYS